MVRKGISKNISDLTLANKKLSLKNLFLSSLFFIEQVETTILEIFKVGLSIFWAQTLVFCVLKPN